MAATWKDAESVVYWINGIGRGMNFPFPRSQEERRNLQRELYPKMIAQGIHSDFRKEMEDYLLHGTFGNIRFRYSEFYEFKKTVRALFLEWLLKRYSLPKIPRQSYFIMHRTADKICIKKQGYKLVFSIQDNNDKYPIVVRMSEKQLFLLKGLFEHNNLDLGLLKGPLSTLQEALQGVQFCILKYIHRYDESREKPIFWTYSMLSHSAKDLEAIFYKSVEGNFVPNFHPEALPKPQIDEVHVSHTAKITTSHLHIHKKGRINIHKMNDKICISFKNELICILHKDRFSWLCTPRHELIPSLEQALNLRTAS